MCPSNLNQDIDDVIAVYEDIIGGTAARTRRMIQQYGSIGALSRLVTSADLQRGFRVLRDSGRLEYSFEEVIVRHADSFSRDVVEAARWRLDNADSL
ncbi:MAG: hypothetical protein OXD44_07805 [Gammaproteobacteria bacterium]|nr:hypothetical protein [Gammaproteobacteria bacterium]